MATDPAPASGTPEALALARIEAHASREPGRLAIASAASGGVTRGQLDALARRVAAAILAAGSGPGARLAVLSDDAPTLAAGLLGTLRASAVFVPLDPEDPAARLAAVLADTAPALLLATGAARPLAARLAAGRIPVLDTGTLPPPAIVLPLPAGPGALAWIMFTSGSTGRPKGVMQTRGNVVTYAGQVIDGLGLGPDDGLLVASPLTVHAGATISLAGLVAGVPLVLVDLRRISVERLAAIIHERAVTVVFAVPTVFRALARLVAAGGTLSPATLARVRLLRLSGETVTRADAELAWRVFPGLTTLSVGLGATETGGISHAYLRRGEPLPPGPVSVGTPVAGVEVALLDERGQPVPEGQPGEIVVTSAHLSPGYWGDRPLTAAAFEDAAGSRRYRTGDLGRRRPDGSLEHLGRRDAQVKIGGQRVELAEIEAALRRLPGVAEAAVRHVGPDPRGLAAYLVLEPGARMDDAAIRAALAAELPPVMVPASYTRLADLPRTRSGKVEVSALPNPRRDTQPAPARRRPSDDERAVCRIWDDVLAPPRPVGPDDDLFALGGDSIQAARILARIEAEFGVRPPLAGFLATPTPAGLAVLIALAPRA
jgi:amino acid adenylation domain-containing protein